MRTFLTLLEVRKIRRRKKGRRDAMGSEERYRTILDYSNDLIWTVDREGNFTFVNKKVEEISGYKRSDLLGKTFTSILPAADMPRVQGILHETLKGNCGQYQISVCKEDGITVVLSIHATPILKSGNVAGVVSYGRDITETNKLEEQLRHFQKIEAIGRLAGGIAHDFNNIITAIIGYANLLLLKSADEPLQNYANQILALSEIAAHTTGSLLAFSRKQVMCFHPVDLNDLIREIEKFLTRIIGEEIKLKTSLADTHIAAMIDPPQIEQVLINLAINAKDAMPSGGVLTIETKIVEMDNSFISAHGYGEPGTYAMISVEDTGIGMDEMTKKRIFEPFFTTKEMGKGTGLGLSTAYGIMKQHHGFINFHSELGKGTTFLLYLPLIKNNC